MVNQAATMYDWHVSCGLTRHKCQVTPIVAGRPGAAELVAGCQGGSRITAAVRFLMFTLGWWSLEMPWCHVWPFLPIGQPNCTSQQLQTGIELLAVEQVESMCHPNLVFIVNHNHPAESSSRPVTCSWFWLHVSPYKPATAGDAWCNSMFAALKARCLPATTTTTTTTTQQQPHVSATYHSTCLCIVWAKFCCQTISCSSIATV